MDIENERIENKALLVQNDHSESPSQLFDIKYNESAYTYYRMDMTCRSGNILQLALWKWKMEAATYGFSAVNDKR